MAAEIIEKPIKRKVLVEKFFTGTKKVVILDYDYNPNVDILWWYKDFVGKIVNVENVTSTLYGINGTEHYFFYEFYRITGDFRSRFDGYVILKEHCRIVK